MGLWCAEVQFLCIGVSVMFKSMNVHVIFSASVHIYCLKHYTFHHIKNQIIEHCICWYSLKYLCWCVLVILIFLLLSFTVSPFDFSYSVFHFSRIVL